MSTPSGKAKRLSLQLPAWRYPWFYVSAIIRRTLLRLAHDFPLSKRASDDDWIARDEPNIPPHLSQYQPNEILKWKGVEFRVLKVIGDPMPSIILVPASSTHGKRVAALRAINRRQQADRRQGERRRVDS